MSDEEAEDLKNSIFPVGKERWIKFKFIDRDKCMKTFRWKNGEEYDGQGYAVTALGLRDEYTPQISAIMDLRENVCGHLLDVLNYEQVQSIHRLFNEKIKEVKERTILEI